MDSQKTLSPHILIFPLPLQGPVNCMLKLAELLCLADFHVTFLNTDHVQHRLLRYTDVQSRFTRYPKFRFQAIGDGLSEDHPRSGDLFTEMVDGMEAVTYPNFTEMVTSGNLSSKSEQPVTCIIADGLFSFAGGVAQQIGIPLIYFETISPCGLWIHLCVPKLIEAGELPFKGDDLDARITCVPGMEGFLRRRDLSSFCRSCDPTDPLIKLILKENQELQKAQGVIINTFEELEGPLLSHMRSLCPNLYAIGPLHTHHRARLGTSHATFSNSLWEEDKSCLAWLDAQPLKSVIFVSIGSLAVMTKDQLLEFWHGLVNSGKLFLWVRQHGSIAGDITESQIPVELLEGTRKRGCIVGWAPQEEVLANPAIGGFLTHSGWNSTLENIVAGVPMACWPYFVDQQVNSRFVGEVWKLGLDMKDTCDRVIVEKMIKELMEERKDEFMGRANQMSKLARKSVSEGGSSFCNLDRLMEDIRVMSLQASKS
ncbi:unnamed protein product [Ilex paraguariensis]|uniref:7-deoxyloganetic acid glucosyltransferase n=1 Tax=Ilex paraguariensis TaxID=185542 RepID=A0ABC8QTW6_9AQUA